MDYSANKHRIVCGWNEELNCYVYRGDVKNYPPLAGDEGRGDVSANYSLQCYLAFLTFSLEPHRAH